mmetsp:Transcript_69387/g.176216  ORF Transcript_69387/g.176216 Transcript_69387/m.176216 type:complete len:153 (-) Transcript_69387:84-542(-)
MAAASPGAATGAAALDSVPDGHDPRYDEVVSTNQSSSFSWLVGSKPKPAAEVRDEKYAGYLISLDKVMADWQRRVLTDQEAMVHGDWYVQKIQGLGRVDSNKCRELLMGRGIDDQRRLDLQSMYQEVKHACGQKTGFGKDATITRKAQGACC